MAVTIHTNITDAEAKVPCQRKLYYDETGDKWWAVYEDGDDIFYETSTDGSTWGSRTQLSGLSGSDNTFPTCCSDGTYLYVFWVADGNGADGIYVRRITLSDGTLYPTADEKIVVDLGNFALLWAPSADCNADGDIMVMLAEEGAGPWLSTDNAENWSDTNDGNSNAEISDHMTIIVGLSTDKFMCIHDEGGNNDNDIHYTIYDVSVGSWGSSTEIVDNLWTDSADPTEGRICNAVHIGSDKVLFVAPAPGHGTASDDVSIYHFDGSSTWTLRNNAGNETDSYSEANQDSTFQTDGSGALAIGQSITGDGGSLTSSEFYIRKAGSPTGNIISRLYNITGTHGTDATPTGSALASSGNIDISGLSTSYALQSFSFSGYTLENGTNYAITCEYTDGDSSNRLEMGFDGSSPTHDGNYSAVAIGSWGYNSNKDTCFYVYTGGVSTPSIESVTIAWDSVNSVLYLIYINENNYPAYVTSDDEGVSWSAETVIEAEASYTDTLSINQTSAEKLGVYWCRSSDDALRFEEIVDLTGEEPSATTTPYKSLLGVGA